MTDILILVGIYVLGILLIALSYRLHSSKHWDIWLDEDCRPDIVWVIPFLNLIVAILNLAFGLVIYYDKKYK